MNSLIKQIVESKFNFNIDIEGNENSLSKSKYSSLTLKLLVEFKDCIIDLGLPSGTLWWKYNLGCDIDLLNNNPELTTPKDWYGNYYAWGETKPKSNYDWDSYKFEKTLTKYNSKDLLILLLPEDDAAYLNMHIGNYKFYIPTRELFEELFFLKYRYIKHKYIKNLYGVMFKSKINENELFLPAAGYYNEYGYENNDKCFYWSLSSLKSKDKIVVSYFYYANNITASINLGYKTNGCSIRPVINL